MNHPVVSQEEWIKARKDLLAQEKEFTKLRDAMTAQIRALPWRRIERRYTFDGSTGKLSLGDLFVGKNQLAIYHFMLGPDWEQGCKSCSFWADGFQGIPIHLAHRDVSFVVVSRAPLHMIEQFKSRMGWTFPWVSSFENDFNFDYHVSFREEELKRGEAFYNYRTIDPGIDELPGMSAFHKDADGSLHHTYSAYARGLEGLLGAFSFLDMVPKGRNEPNTIMEWVRHHDRYDKASPHKCHPAAE